MSNEYIVVDYSQRIRYFDEKTFYKFINEGIVSGRLTSGYTFMKKFPLPSNNSTLENPNDQHDARDWGKDSKGHRMGRYCPFGVDKGWKPTDLIVLRNGTIFVPKKVMVTKVVEEFAPDTDATPAPKINPPAAKKAPAKKTRK